MTVETYGVLKGYVYVNYDGVYRIYYVGEDLPVGYIPPKDWLDQGLIAKKQVEKKQNNKKKELDNE